VFRRSQQHHVGWHAASFLDVDQVADFKLCTGNADGAPGCQLSKPGRVHLLVTLIPSDIIDCLTNNCDRKDKAQRPPIGVEISDLKLWYELAQGHHQEKHVEEELELVVQDHGQK